MAAGSRALFGDFLLGFRLAPMLAMTATVGLTAEFARINGGGRFAQWLSGLCLLFGVEFLVFGLLVSTDMLHNPNSSIVDISLTKVLGGDLVHVVSWYDNEWGYSMRVVDLIDFLGKKGL